MPTAVSAPQKKPVDDVAARQVAQAIERSRSAGEKGSLQIRSHKETPYYEARWRDLDRVDRRKRLGPAWAKRDQDGKWIPRRGRVAGDLLDERRAYPRMIEAIERHEEELLSGLKSQLFEHVVFDDVIPEYLLFPETEKRVKPSTLRDVKLHLARPSGKRGQRGARIMRFFGGRELFGILTRDVRKFLAELDKEDVSPRTVNIHRALLHAVFEYARREETYGLPDNPVAATHKRPEDGSKPIETLEPDEIEAIASVARSGRHRRRSGYANSKYSAETEREWKRINDQDAAMFILAFNAGLRMGELLALRWKDVDTRNNLINVSRAISDGVETSTKSRKARQVPLNAQARTGANPVTASRPHIIRPVV